MLKTDTFHARHLKLINILTILIVLGFGYFFLLKPKYAKIKNYREDLKNKEQEFILREKHLDYLEKTKLDLEKISEKDLEKISLLLPQKKDIPGIFVQMDSIARKNRLSLISVGISEKEEKKEKFPASPEARKEEKIIPSESFIKELNVTLSLEGGSYQDFKGFLKTVEENIRILDVTSLSFDPKGASYNVSLRTYYFNP